MATIATNLRGALAFVTGVLLVAALAFSPDAAAQQGSAVGTIEVASGSVTVAQEGKAAQPATAGTNLMRGDTVRTAAGGKARLKFRDGSTVSLGEETTFQVARFTHNAARGSRVAQFDLIGGILRAIVPPAQAKDSRFEIRTPAAVAAVRSTDWMIEHTGKAETHVFVGEGAVAVTSTGAQVGRAVLNAGDGTTVVAGSAPIYPRPWGQPRIENFRQRTTVN